MMIIQALSSTLALAWRRGLPAAALLLLAGAVLSQPAVPSQLPPVLRLDAVHGAVELGASSEVWNDASGAVPVEEVGRAPALPWRRSIPGEIHRVGPGTALWLRFAVQPVQPGRWYLEVPFPAVDRVTLHTRDEQGRWHAAAAGDHLPVAHWPVPYRHPVLPLTLAPHAPSLFLLQVENRANFSAPLRLLSESRLAVDGHRLTLVLGMYLGLALVAVVFSLGGAIVLRERTHALYALAVALMALTQAAMTGLGGVHLWPQWPWWNERSSFVLPVPTMAAFLLFFTAVLSLAERSRSFHRVVTAVALLALPVAVIIPLLGPQGRFLTMLGYVAIGGAAGTCAVLWAWRRGDRYAPWIVGAMLPVTVGCALPLARGAGLLPMNAWTIHGMQVALALEIPLLLLVLLQRSQRQREHSRRMQGLDRLDPATGLLNAQVFRERLVRLIARSQRLKLRSAVLLVEIVNIESIQERFGRELAREMPLRMAGRLLSAARDIDTVARLAEHRFGLLLEGPLKAVEVAQAGPWIVARCLMPHPHRPLEWAPRLRVVQGLVPMDGTDADDLMSRLEQLLASEGDAAGVRSLSRRGLAMRPPPADLADAP